MEMPNILIPFLGSLKNFLTNGFTIGLVVLFFNKLQDFIATVLNWLLTKVEAIINIDPVLIIYDGFSGYLITTLRIDDSLTVFMSFVLIRFTLSMIPFL